MFCQSTITRYVWSGDQILWEMRVAGEDSADLEKTAWSSGTPSAIRFGRVSYLHAGGIDRPLAIAKEAVGTIVPHQGTNGVWEEYRYDPLGRRILVRAVREDLCAGMSLENGRKLCQSTLTRYVWSGDQILWEMRVPGADGEDLEKTAWSTGAANPTRFGRVSYLHAGGIDRPLAITKDGVGTIVPHQNWRGMFAWGTWATGANKGLRSDCTTGNQTGCMSLAWPGWQTSAWHEDGNPGENEYWMGSLVDGMRDASGQIYMRNRYYDPATGQFTQTDPIGLAGGLNAYGFAAGDPVSYSDPYGLCPKDANGEPDPECVAEAQEVARRTGELNRRINQWNAAVRSGGSADHSGQGHLHRLIRERNELQERLNALNDCDDDDDFRPTRNAAANAIARPVFLGPARYPRKAEIPARETATAVGAVGLGYLVYRGIRMLPSLFPAAWPTIPANLAIP